MLRELRCAYQAYGSVGRIRRYAASGKGAELRLMRCAYQAYGSVGWIRRYAASGKGAELRLMRFAYQAYGIGRPDKAVLIRLSSPGGS